MARRIGLQRLLQCGLINQALMSAMVLMQGGRAMRLN
jgi:hypothetical protein